MKKSILIKFLIIIMSVFAVLGVTACEEHTHTYSSEWSYDDTHHFKKATCEHSSEIIDKQAHTMNGNSCTECDYRTLSVGLEYKLNIDGESYSVIGKGECNDTNIVIPSTYEGKPVTFIGGFAFVDCDSLTSIEIPNSVTSIGSYAFRYCTSLTSVTIPNSVTSIGSYAFSDCISLTSITIPNSVTSIGDGAFYNCNSLARIEIPNSVTSIGSGVFSSCTSLTTIEIPNSVTSIDSYAFYYCTSLTSVTIPNSVTSIGNRAFEDCFSLTSIIIPNSVTSIGSWAFYKCSSLTIYCEATSKPSGWNSSWNVSNCPVYWYSESEPTSSGNYWHYVDGVVTKW